MTKPGFQIGAGSPDQKKLSKSELIKDTTTQNFMPDVIEASQKTPVLVDFWSLRSPSSKQFSIVLEKIVSDAKGAVRLVKMNVDEHPTIFAQLASQLGMRSVPAVIVFHGGRPIDGFMGALPESQVKRFIENLIGEDIEDDLESVFETAEEAFNEGDYETALEVYSAILQEENDHVGAIAGLAKCYIKLSKLDLARQTLELTPPAKQNDTHVANARAMLDLAEKSSSLGDLSALKTKAAQNPTDYQARFDLALALNASGDREGAMNELLEIIKRTRTWNEDGARIQLLQFFDAWGPKDPVTLEGRQRLSILLFS